MNTHDRTTAPAPGSSDADPGSAAQDDFQPQLASRSILVAVNGGPSGWTALDWAAAQANVHDSDLRIMHAISWPRWSVDPVGGLALDWCNTNAPYNGALILQAAASRARVVAPHATITTHLEAGEPAAVIVRASQDDTLIVVGRGRNGRPGGRSVARTVVRLAQCPIAVIRVPIAGKPGGVRR